MMMNKSKDDFTDIIVSWEYMKWSINSHKIFINFKAYHLYLMLILKIPKILTAKLLLSFYETLHICINLAIKYPINILITSFSASNTDSLSQRNSFLSNLCFMFSTSSFNKALFSWVSLHKIFFSLNCNQIPAQQSSIRKVNHLNVYIYGYVLGYKYVYTYTYQYLVTFYKLYVPVYAYM